jgi:hypothetical protein
MEVRYTRRLSPGDTGPDVEAVGRALCRAGFGVKLSAYNALPARVRRTWGWRKRRWLRAFKRAHKLPPDAVYGKGAHAALSPHFDAYGRSLMASYKPPVKLVEPRQGWGSLDRSLWELYSIAIGTYGMSDLGTYNSASRLPGGGISDHAKGPPALAFDVGIDPDVGMADPEGRAFFNLCARDRRVEYAILGDRIGSFRYGTRPYTSGGHLNHVHVSGRHSRLVRAAFRAQDLAYQALA